MATVRISVSTGRGEYQVELERPETNAQVWGGDNRHINNLLDSAAAQIKRAYNDPAKGASE